MIDYLGLSTSTAIDWPGLENLKGKWLLHPSSLYYRHRKSLFRNGVRVLSLSREPILGGDAFRIDLNPSKFSNLKDLGELLSPFLDLEAMIVRRLDSAVDVPLKMAEVMGAVQVGRKLCVTKFERNCELATYYAGTRPEEIKLYNKAKQAGIEGDLTRIEVLMSKHKVPVRHFWEIRRLNHNPFKQIRGYRVRADLSGKVEVKKGEKLRDFIEVHGFHNARRVLNRDGNFSRDYGPCLEIDPNFPDLGAIYNKEISIWIGGTNVI